MPERTNINRLLLRQNSVDQIRLRDAENSHFHPPEAHLADFPVVAFL